MADINEKIRQAVTDVLVDVEFVIGYQKGYDALHATPLFVKETEQVNDLIFDRTCVHNLATYLNDYRERKIGLMVKGCDSRSVIQLLQEKLIERDDIVIIGIPCDGVLSLEKIRTKMDINRVQDVSFKNGEVFVKVGGKTTVFPYHDVAADKCLSCSYPNPLLFDKLVDEPLEPLPQVQDRFARINKFEEKSLQERFEFWRREMSRCLRCYACRNACPLCACKDYCLGESREPHYQSQESNVREKWFFQMIHAMHLAGRCTECGECERACPMDIPVLLFKKKMASVIDKVFDYEAGIDPVAVPPLLTYQVEEENVKEAEWE